MFVAIVKNSETSWDVVCKTCPFCRKVQRTIYGLDPEAVLNWTAGMKIQQAFPHLSSIDREALISGTCSDKCWNVMEG